MTRRDTHPTYDAFTPRASELPGFIPYRRGDRMTDETRAKLQAALNFKPFVHDLVRLGQQSQEVDGTTEAA